MRYAALTDLGKKRNLNEDSYIANGHVFAVADGMGGHRAGEIASALALDTIRFGLAKRSKDSFELRLREAIQKANKQVHETAQRDIARHGMGTTLTVAVPINNKLYIGHVGDSRLYRLRNDNLKQLTRDHSLVAQMVESGQIKAEEAETHPHRNIITRAIGSDSDVEIDIVIEDILAGDRYLLCTDGLTTMLSDDEIASVLRSNDDIESAARKLIELANERGGNDNITVVLFEPRKNRSSLLSFKWLTRR